MLQADGVVVVDDVYVTDSNGEQIRIGDRVVVDLCNGRTPSQMVRECAGFRFEKGKPPFVRVGEGNTGWRSIEYVHAASSSDLLVQMLLNNMPMGTRVEEARGFASTIRQVIHEEEFAKRMDEEKVVLLGEAEEEEE